MQEKPLLTQLQSAYPKKFHNQFIFFKHELHTISPEGNNPVYNTNCMNFILPYFIIIKTSMATPQNTNDHFPRKTRNSPEKISFIPIAA